MHNTKLALYLLTISCSSLCLANQNIKLVIYKNSTCQQQYGTIKLNILKACVNYSYVDAKGITIRGSLGHFRCYPDKLVYAKFPFDSNCPMTAKMKKLDYSVPADPKACQRALSHEGFVYERLLNYKYPGHKSCKP